MRTGVQFFLQKMGKGTFFQKQKVEVGKIVEEGFLGRLTYGYLITYLCPYKSKKHYNLRYIQE